MESKSEVISIEPSIHYENSANVYQPRYKVLPSSRPMERERGEP